MKVYLVKIFCCVLLLLATTTSKSTKPRWLTTINISPLKGSKIDITLSNIGRQENCSLVRGNLRINGYAFNTRNLVVPHNRTELVSCRYQLGPVDKRHLGVWTICGRTDEDSSSDRCQRIIILETKDDCRVTTNHTVHVMGGSNYALNQTDTTFTECHVLTPYGEDLVLTEYSDYPGIRLLDSSSCKVVIRQRKTTAVENWTVYGRVETIFSSCQEVRYPVKLYASGH